VVVEAARRVDLTHLTEAITQAARGENGVQLGSSIETYAASSRVVPSVRSDVLTARSSGGGGAGGRGRDFKSGFTCAQPISVRRGILVLNPGEGRSVRSKLSQAIVIL
jgi:hypothetical protein